MDKSEYRCKDLFEGSLIYSKGQELLRLEPEGDFFWFVFQDDNNMCESLANLFWAGKIEVNAKHFADSISTLKNRIFSIKSGGR